MNKYKTPTSAKNLLPNKKSKNEIDRLEIERSMYFLGKALYQYSLLKMAKKNSKL